MLALACRTDDGSAVDSSTTIDGPTAEGTGSASVGDDTSSIPGCGNGVAEAAEACDGLDLRGATCESLGHPSVGALGCTEACELDNTGCAPPGMVYVEEGTFTMGSVDISPNEEPVREVYLDRYWIDRTEVTMAAYTACVDAGACTEPTAGDECNWGVAGREDHPVSCVTWFQAEAYCGWVDGGARRLPTEAEWEKAARGTDGRTYPWGEAPAPTCSHVVMYEEALGERGCGMGSTWPVGSKPMGASPYGVLDLPGSVWEWVADWFAFSYDPTQTVNPTGPTEGTSRVVRGGSWETNGGSTFRTSDRDAWGPDVTYQGVMGFRCAGTPP
ncbi:MAG: SUMF1/EgtB/PvdO family nonheme iron enzyme [Myxococcales bacterium]|nr:SUMF1/EgtB/PvdO family nonheme iron enzyme [Myxococcales bacterium]